ncbi:PIN domain-containing protein (plasmid) [Methylosinus sp. C49]|uniref:putative toxin-antitoxin system toxin component, PIN family n=1 Tax=Methylosinus sp. C49 TaxID=2699395 RepID=UPI0013671AA5|nr:putative toxin-antitoxin system toxin component, PIN family [Methylosinus sp. C49]BBU63864.1 PIN domain-containing protein [Methylosinus sp. C49]BBU64248.1 PIN domain-containing protein [Methylosinus sp. C49]
MKRLVLDTSVIVSAFRSSRGASFVILSLVAKRRLVPLVSTALFLEYEDVLQRPEQRDAHGLDPNAVSKALRELAALCEPVEPHFSWRPQLSDPADEMVLEVALNERADGIVTHNVRDFHQAVPKFGIPVLTPGALLERIGK